VLRLRCRGWESARRKLAQRGRPLPSRVWSLGVRLHLSELVPTGGTCIPWRPSMLAHVDASALRGCNELVTSRQVSAETPERALGMPIDTIHDSCAARAALGGGGVLFSCSELVHAEVDAPRSSSARASQRVQKPRGGAPWPGAVPGMIAVWDAKLMAAKKFTESDAFASTRAPSYERGIPVPSASTPTVPPGGCT
jgi:hypothetical protein